MPGSVLWLWRLSPPKFRGTVSTGPIRWQVALAPRITPLCLSEAVLFEERWTIRNGLPLAVAGRSTAELDAWLVSGTELKHSDSQPWEMSEGTLTFRQSELEALRFLALPRLLWLIVVSLAVLLWALLFARLKRGTVWLLLASLGMLGLLLFFFWPQMVRQALAASIPGIVVVLLVLFVQRTLQARYRWKIANMPAFRRTISESALARPSGQRPLNGLLRETSTIDAVNRRGFDEPGAVPDSPLS
jgi:hypothetical protein